MNSSEKNNNLGATLAKMALDDIPKPSPDAKEIVGLIKHSGRVSGYQLSDGTAVSREKGVAMAKAGEIKGVGVAHRRETEYLKSIPDATEGNNLNSLPSVSSDSVEKFF